MDLNLKNLDSRNLRRIGLTSAAIFSVLVLFTVVTLIVEFFLNQEIDHRLARALGGLPPGVEFHYDRVRTSLWTETVSLRDVTVKAGGLPEPLAIHSLSVGRIDFATLFKILSTHRPALPSSIWMEADGVQLKRSALPENAVEFLDKLGLDHVDLTISSGFRFLREKNKVAIRNLKISGVNLAILNFSLDLTRFQLPGDIELFSQIKNHDWWLAQSVEWRKAEIESFELVYKDDSLLPRLDQYLQQAGEPPLRGFVGIIIDAQRSPAGALNESGFVADVLQKLWDFASEPKAIRIVSAPPKPVPLVKLLEDESITDFQSLGQILALKIDVNP